MADNGPLGLQFNITAETSGAMTELQRLEDQVIRAQDRLAAMQANPQLVQQLQAVNAQMRELNGQAGGGMFSQEMYRSYAAVQLLSRELGIPIPFALARIIGQMESIQVLMGVAFGVIVGGFVGYALEKIIMGVGTFLNDTKMAEDAWKELNKQLNRAITETEHLDDQYIKLLRDEAEIGKTIVEQDHLKSMFAENDVKFAQMAADDKALELKQAQGILDAMQKKADLIDKDPSQFSSISKKVQGVDPGEISAQAVKVAILSSEYDVLALRIRNAGKEAQVVHEKETAAIDKDIRRKQDQLTELTRKYQDQQDALKGSPEDKARRAAENQYLADLRAIHEAADAESRERIKSAATIEKEKGEAINAATKLYLATYHNIVMTEHEKLMADEKRLDDEFLRYTESEHNREIAELVKKGAQEDRINQEALDKLATQERESAKAIAEIKITAKYHAASVLEHLEAGNLQKEQVASTREKERAYALIAAKQAEMKAARDSAIAKAQEAVAVASAEKAKQHSYEGSVIAMNQYMTTVENLKNVQIESARAAAAATAEANAQKRQADEAKKTQDNAAKADFAKGTVDQIAAIGSLLGARREMAFFQGVVQTAEGIGALAQQPPNFYSATTHFLSATEYFAAAGKGSGGHGHGGAGGGGSRGLGGSGSGTALWQQAAAGVAPGNVRLASGSSAPPGGTIIVMTSNQETARWVHGQFSAAVQTYGHAMPQPTTPTPVTSGMVK